MRILFFEQVNRQLEASRGQKSGLSVAIGMVAESLESSAVISVTSRDQIVFSLRRFSPEIAVFANSGFARFLDSSLVEMFPKTRFIIQDHSHVSFGVTNHNLIINMAQLESIGCEYMFNDERSALLMGKKWLPNVYKGEFSTPFRKEIKKELNIICAGAIRPMKNQFTQAKIAISYADKLGVKLNFYMNLNSEQGTKYITGNLKQLFRSTKHELVDLGWLPHKLFRSSLKCYHFGMQLSLSESFNVVAADYACAGLPMIVSDEIRWASDRVKVNPFNMAEAHAQLDVCDLSVTESQDKLRDHNETALEIWRGL